MGKAGSDPARDYVRPELAAGLIATAIEEGGARYFANDRPKDGLRLTGGA
jgi:hypothetical protein